MMTLNHRPKKAHRTPSRKKKKKKRTTYRYIVFILHKTEDKKKILKKAEGWVGGGEHVRGKTPYLKGNQSKNYIRLLIRNRASRNKVE